SVRPFLARPAMLTWGYLPASIAAYPDGRRNRRAALWRHPERPAITREVKLLALCADRERIAPERGSGRFTLKERAPPCIKCSVCRSNTSFATAPWRGSKTR